MKISKLMKKLGVGMAVALSIFGCGSASNDQGVSFTLAGFGALTIDTTTGLQTCSTSTITNSITTPLGESDDGRESSTLACLLMQNHLTNMAIRSERAEISYYIPGADMQPPTTSVPAFVYLSPVTASGTSTETDTTSTTEDNPGVAQIVSFPVNIVPPEITSWLSLNRNSLPEPPFSMDISVQVYGITTAGDVIVTNQGYLQAQVTNDFVIDEGDGVIPDATPTTSPIIE